MDPCLRFQPHGLAASGYDRVKAELDFISYETWSGGVGLYKELPQGITVDLNGEVRFSEFDDMHPLAGVTRKDTRLTGTVAFTKRDFNIYGLCPIARIHLRLQRQQHRASTSSTPTPWTSG